jgi:hypothetical protein
LGGETVRASIELKGLIEPSTKFSGIASSVGRLERNADICARTGANAEEEEEELEGELELGGGAIGKGGV